MALDDTLKERHGQHGKFEDNAETTEKILGILRDTPNYHKLPNLVKVGIWHIVHKLARACCGDWRHKDHWHDIGGYSKLIEDYVTPVAKPDIPKDVLLCDCDRPIPDGFKVCMTCNHIVE